MKTIAVILFAFFMVWQPVTAKSEKAAKCCGVIELNCATCCCVQQPPTDPRPVTPVQSRPAAQEPITLLLPTVSELNLEQEDFASIPPQAAILKAAGAIPLFMRDCAILI